MACVDRPRRYNGYDNSASHGRTTAYVVKGPASAGCGVTAAVTVGLWGAETEASSLSVTGSKMADVVVVTGAGAGAGGGTGACAWSSSSGSRMCEQKWSSRVRELA